jgi:two-component system, chemotaxis family, CheB/CheR fusion protein
MNEPCQPIVSMPGESGHGQRERVSQGSGYIDGSPGAVRASSPSPSFAGQAVNNAPAPRRILVVDDHVDSAESLAMMLKYLGNETQVAYDGLAAVAAAAEFLPTIILMDVEMPKLNGFDACRRIRAETLNGKEALIVAMTGWSREEDRLRCREAGFDKHLVKPVSLQSLISALDEA